MKSNSNGCNTWLCIQIERQHRLVSVADPGFPVGGIDLVGGAPTPEVVMFRKFCVSKRKNLDPWGERAPGTPPRSANVYGINPGV